MTETDHRILVVDDDPNIAKLIRFYLNMPGSAIETATDGKQGLQLARKGGYDLVLLDMQMPHMDGMTFLKTISDMPGFNTLLIIITAHDPDDEMLAAIKQNAFDYIQKPFTANRLRLTVHNALRHKALQEKYSELIDSVIRG